MPLVSAVTAMLSRQSKQAPKGVRTRAVILETALGIARRDGLEGLTIGSLAEQAGMSKSGVFAHFGSREELQLAVLAEYRQRFVDDVLRPAVRKPRGLPRLQVLLESWLKQLARELEQGCLMISGAIEYDDRPGPLHDAMVDIIAGWKGELVRAIEQAKAERHLRADADSAQLAFEIYGLMLALHQDARLLRSTDSVRRARQGLARLLSAVTQSGAGTTKRRAVGARVSTAASAAVSAGGSGASKTKSSKSTRPSKSGAARVSHIKKTH